MFSERDLFYLSLSCSDLLIRIAATLKKKKERNEKKRALLIFAVSLVWVEGHFPLLENKNVWWAMGDVPGGVLVWPLEAGQTWIVFSGRAEEARQGGNCGAGGGFVTSLLVPKTMDLLPALVSSFSMIFIFSWLYEAPRDNIDCNYFCNRITGV